MGKSRKKYHPYPPLLKGSKKPCKRKPVLLHQASGKRLKLETIFFLLFFGDVTYQQMKTVSVIYAGGTFKVVPKKFYQLLKLQCNFSDVLIPVFYALMTSKSQRLYLFLFHTKFSLNFKPTKCVVNFEIPSFHHSYLISSKCKCNDNFSIMVKLCGESGQDLALVNMKNYWNGWKIMALPLLPENKIELCFYALTPTVSWYRS